MYAYTVIWYYIPIKDWYTFKPYNITSHQDENEEYVKSCFFKIWGRLKNIEAFFTQPEMNNEWNVRFIIFTQPLRSGWIWHEVNFLSGV